VSGWHVAQAVNWRFLLRRAWKAREPFGVCQLHREICRLPQPHVCSGAGRLQPDVRRPIEVVADRANGEPIATGTESTLGEFIVPAGVAHDGGRRARASRADRDEHALHRRLARRAHVAGERGGAHALQSDGEADDEQTQQHRYRAHRHPVGSRSSKRRRSATLRPRVHHGKARGGIRPFRTGGSPMVITARIFAWLAGAAAAGAGLGGTSVAVVSP